MADARGRTSVYLEVGKRRVFAGAVDWPGWSRSGKDEDGALQALLDSAPRYAAAMRRTKRQFSPPKDVSRFEVVQRLTGDATTDFGAPGKVPSVDTMPVTKAELDRLTAVLKASWAAFDTAARKATGAKLRTGPRGGGRNLDAMMQHVLDSDGAYLRRIGGTYRGGTEGDRRAEMRSLRREILATLASVATGPPVRKGPRGGVRWTPRTFVRRSAWHALDHAWEIEDRAGPS